MDPRIFMRGLEEQLRRVKSQYLELTRSSEGADVNPTELLNNAVLWFLRTLQNTDLIYEDLTMNASEYVSDEAFAKKKAPPYDYMYPSMLWLISLLAREQIDNIFGLSFYNRLSQYVATIPAQTRNGYGLSNRG